MTERFESKVSTVLNQLYDMLVEKNNSYGDAALNPVGVFSSLSAEEGIKVRIDDKLGRLKNQPDAFDEDALLDLIGYLVLLRVAQKEFEEPHTGDADRQ